MSAVKIKVERKNDNTETGLKAELKNIRCIIEAVESSNGAILENIEQWNDLYDFEGEIVQELRVLLRTPNVNNFVV